MSAARLSAGPMPPWLRHRGRRSQYSGGFGRLVTTCRPDSPDYLPREREVGDPAGGGDCLDVVGVLEAFQAVPDADAAAEHDRYLDQMHVVDEAGGEEVT